jgi:hypothetical protein
MQERIAWRHSFAAGSFNPYSMRRYLLIALLCLNIAAIAQEDESGISSDFRSLNQCRIRTDMTGMKVLGTWGAANTVAGVAGMIAARDDDWKHFHQMNTVWGVVNLGIAGMGYLGARRERVKEYSNSHMLHRYESTKRLYLLNAGLDGLYIGTGAFLTQHARHGGDPELYRGFGRSLLLQGAGLLIFDVSMFCAHHSQDKRWYKILQGVAFTGTGLSLNYALN